MATNVLTDAKCKGAKAGDKPVKVFDGGGLFLFISPTGAKVWRLTYRIDGKAQTLVIGPYPSVSLAEARQKREKAKVVLREGQDPKAAQKARKAGRTLDDAHDAYWSGRKDLSASYLENERRAYEMHVQPVLGKRLIRDIARPDVLDCLNQLDAKGKHDYVRKIRMWLAQVWDWAIEQGEATENPPRSIKPERAFGKRQVEHFAALEPREIPAFMERLEAEGELQSVLALKMLALTWVRTNELRFMTWAEIQGDTWIIPAGKMKRRRDHVVPLSTKAQELLAVLKPRAGRSEYVFPADHRPDRPISENAVLALIARMGYKGRMTGHGFRTVASTWAHESGYLSDAVELQLSHAPENKVKSAYNRAQHLPLRRAMLEAWSVWLMRTTPASQTSPAA
jgi:integrase